MTSMTFHFRKIYEIFIFKFTDFFVRNFVFLISSFTIFASFFFIFRFVSINRVLYIVIFIDVIDIWLSIKKIYFFWLCSTQNHEFFFHQKKFRCARIFESIFFSSLRKRMSKQFRNIVLRKCECNACRKFEYFWYFSENSDNCVFNFSICVINSSIDWLNFCLTCFNFWSIFANRICSDFKCFCRKNTKIFHV